MTFKSNNSASNNNNNADFSRYSHETNNNNNNNQNSDLSESINRSLDQTKNNINRSIDESRNQIPRYNEIVNSYQQQSLQTAKEISEEYIESQKAVINSLQSAWRPYSESFNGMVSSFASPDSMTKAYTKCVSSFADNAVSAIRLTNNMIFSNLDSMKSTLQQARDNSKHLSNLNVNAARTLENNSRQIASAVSEATDSNSNSNQGSSSDSSTDKTTYSTTATTATTKKQ
jgi:DNA anti-recombination protein RmuC